jgi:hypothetical protein
MGCLDRLQHYPAETQTAAAGMLLVALLRKHGVHASAILNASNNMLERAAAEVPALRTVLSYVNNESL